MTTNAETLVAYPARRGVGVSRTVGCRLQSIWNAALSGQGLYTLEIPNPPQLALNQRHSLVIKYFATADPSGIFYLMETQSTRTEANQRGYPIRGKSGSETPKQKRLKQITLPISAAVRVYSGQLSVEFGSTIEFS